MNIGKFIDEYTKTPSAQIKDGLITKHVVATYVPYETKMAEAKEIVKTTCYKKVDGKQVFWMDTPTRYVLLMKEVISLYTDLEWDQTNFLIQFNLMEQYGLIDKIVKAIGPDYSRFQTVLNMTIEDMITNERSLLSKIDSWLSSAKITFEELANTIDDKISKAIEESGLTDDEITDLIKMLSK